MKIKCNVDVLTFQYPYHDDLKKEVLQYLNGYEDRQFNLTSVKATMTEWNITTRQIEKLKSFVLSNLRFFDDSISSCSVNFGNFWGNIYSKGDYAVPHHHLPFSFSFVYFLHTKFYHSPLIFSDSKKKIRPEEGKFILFPSSVLHEVPKHTHNEKRVTLAGNISWQKK